MLLSSLFDYLSETELLFCTELIKYNVPFRSPSYTVIFYRIFTVINTVYITEGYFTLKILKSTYYPKNISIILQIGRHYKI